MGQYLFIVFHIMRAVVLLSLISLALGKETLLSRFTEFKQKYQKTYSGLDEELNRYNIFKANVASIEAHNSRGSSFTRGVNQFSDLTEEEFKSTYLGLKQLPSNSVPRAAPRSSNSTKDLPNSVNWVTEGAVTSVKDQGQCGSCWAFSLTSQVESYNFLASGDLVELSTQQVTSCTPNTLSCGGTGGCRGSVTQLGFNYLQLFGSVEASSDTLTSESTENLSQTSGSDRGSSSS